VVWGGLGQPNGGRRVLDLAMVVAVECFAAWFILVKTELSLQLMIPQPLGEPEGDGAAVNPSP
jgi:hypothetical protein